MDDYSPEVAIGIIKTMILMRHKGMTIEQAMRVKEYEFETDETNKTICSLSYWLGDGRRKTNHRSIDLSNDTEFNEPFFGVINRMFPQTAPAKSNAPSTD